MTISTLMPDQVPFVARYDPRVVFLNLDDLEALRALDTRSFIERHYRQDWGSAADGIVSINRAVLAGEMATEPDVERIRSEFEIGGGRLLVVETELREGYEATLLWLNR